MTNKPQNTQPMMISLDYELFFGTSTGTIEACLLQPLSALMQAIEPYNQKLVLFVDVAYLLKLKQSTELEHRAQFEQVAQQLSEATAQGHEVQLHIHPHWEDSHWSNGTWQIDSRRYRLHDFPEADRHRLTLAYADLIENITSVRPIAYRAGGWCLQPFAEIAQPLWDAGISIDSTVYRNGISVNEGRGFDFTNAPDKMCWRFGDDPLQEQADGRFQEVAISALQVDPLFFWRVAFGRVSNKFFPSTKRNTFGDGAAMNDGGAHYRDRLLGQSTIAASIDGEKASLLPKVLEQNAHQELLNVMGHPKAMTPNSISNLVQFLETGKTSSVVFADLVNEPTAITGEPVAS